MYIVGDGPAKPGDTHYIHVGTTSECKNCGYQERFWNHETGAVPQKPYQHSIVIGTVQPSAQPFKPIECKIPLTDHYYLFFYPSDTYMAIKIWHKFQEERHTIGLTQALDNVVKNLDLKPAQAPDINQKIAEKAAKAIENLKKF